jgi:hypothetical protein
MAENSAFVICPLGEVGSEVRKRADWLLTAVVRPVLRELNYTVGRAALDPIVTPITQEVSRQLYEADLVLADVSGGNPNVMYELGRRHAWGGSSLILIHASTDLSYLPFDIKDYPVALQYAETTDAELIEKYRDSLRRYVKAVERQPAFLKLGDSELERRNIARRLAKAAKLSFVVSRLDGRQDQYKMACRLLNRPCRTIFLMQRSSTLVLGPEQGWDWEAKFYEILRKAVQRGANLYHVVTLEGIARHLQKRSSTFPGIDNIEDRLGFFRKKENENGLKFVEHPIVGLDGTHRPQLFKRTPSESELNLHPDRQARALIAEFEDGTTEAIMVADLGLAQSSFFMSGPIMADFMRAAIDFYDRCDYLYWDDVEAAVSTSLEDERLRDHGGALGAS